MRRLEPQGTVSVTTFAQFEQSVAGISEALARAPIHPFDRILFFAENSTDYQALQIATQALRAEPCAVFANLSGTAVCDIAQRVRPRGVYVSSQEQWNKLEPILETLLRAGLFLRISSAPLSPVAGIVDRHPDEMARTDCPRATWEERVDAVLSTDPFLLLFTSGTTGRQKGVVLRQDAFVRSLEGGRAATSMTEADDGLLFLPFAHVAGQCQFMLAVAVGHSLILVSERSQLPQAFGLGPTYCFGVPRIYEKVKDQVWVRLSEAPGALRKILEKAYLAACHPEHLRHFAEHGLAVFARHTLGKRLRAILGGRLRFLASCGAPTSPSLASFFETLGLPLLSFYGMSETCGLIASQCAALPRTLATVGLPTPDLELSFSPEGELCIKGPVLMQGYLDDEDNAAAYDEQAFFHTGDLAILDVTTGEMSIAGRTKNLLVLSTGKKFSPEPIEERLSTLPLVDAALLVGENRPYVAAIVFLSPGASEASQQNLRALANALHTEMLRHLDDLSDFERPKRLLVVAKGTSERSDWVTPTLKLKRHAVLDAFANALDALYTAPTESVLVVE